MVGKDHQVIIKVGKDHQVIICQWHIQAIARTARTRTQFFSLVGVSSRSLGRETVTKSKGGCSY